VIKMNCEVNSTKLLRPKACILNHARRRPLEIVASQKQNQTKKAISTKLDNDKIPLDHKESINNQT
jgi:hypothetical protein